MATKLIQLEDGTLVEVETPTGGAEQISGGFAEKVNTTLDKVQPVLVKVCHSVQVAWKEISQEIAVESAEIELGLSFEGEGNLYVTKAKAGANFTVKLVLKSQG